MDQAKIRRGWQALTGSPARRHWLIRYGFACLVVLIAFGIRHLLDPVLVDRIPLTLFVTTAVVAAWLGGFGPGILAMVFGGILVKYSFIAPEGGFGFIGAGDAILLGSYATSSLICITAMEGLHRSRRKALVASETAVKESERRAAEAAERERAERTLLENEERLRSALRAGRIMAFDWDVISDEVIRSENAAELLGRPDAVRGWGRDFDRCVHPEDLPRLQRVMRNLHQQGGVYREQFRLRRGDGSIMWVEDIAEGTFDENGRLVRLRGLMVDITEQKRAEEALLLTRRQAEARRLELEAVMAAVPAAVWIAHDPECRHVTGNPTGHELLRTPPRRNLSKTAPEAEQPRHFEVFRHGRRLSGEELPMQVAGRTGKPVLDNELEVRFADGTSMWEYGNAVPLLNADGSVRGVVAVFIDITQRKRMEEALREREEWYRASFELASVGKSEADPHTGRYLRVNARLCAMTGYTASELLEKTFLDITHPEDRDQDWSQYRHLMEGSANEYALEKRYLRKDGGTVWVHLNCAVVRDSRGLPLRAIAVIQDITERKLAEKALSRYRERLEELVAERTEDLKQSMEQLERSERLASLGTLATGIAHEINNPLNAIIMSAEYAALLASQPEPESSGEMNGCMVAIKEQALRAGRIVKAVMKFAQNERTPKSPGALNPLVRRVAGLARTYLAGQWSLELDLAEVPPVRMNEMEIEQVLLNLIRNAIDASEGKARVVVRTAQHQEEVELSVSDDGPGIPEQGLSRIFDPFYTTRRKTGGTGLGLSICHRIISDHDGTIGVRSKRGEGTCFSIRLPLATSALVEAEGAIEVKAAVSRT